MNPGKQRCYAYNLRVDFSLLILVVQGICVRMLLFPRGRKKRTPDNIYVSAPALSVWPVCLGLGLGLGRCTQAALRDVGVTCHTACSSVDSVHAFAVFFICVQGTGSSFILRRNPSTAIRVCLRVMYDVDVYAV